MDETRIDTSELQQLVTNDTEGENNESSIVQEEETVEEPKVISPVKSTKVMSSGNTSTTHSSVTRLATRYNPNFSSNPGPSKVSFVNERRNTKDAGKAAAARPRNPHKVEKDTTTRHHTFLSEVPDVQHMERALLGLLDDFHSGKLRAFGRGCTMEQMTNIREQQEKLAKLHFDLCGSTDPSLNDDSLKKSQTTMNQLIQRLEQLSVSIERLHSDTNSNN